MATRPVDDNLSSSTSPSGMAGSAPGQTPEHGGSADSSAVDSPVSPPEARLADLGVRHPAAGPIHAWDRCLAWLPAAGITLAFLAMFAFLFIDESLTRWIHGNPGVVRRVTGWLTYLGDGGPLIESILGAILVGLALKIRRDADHPARPWLGVIAACAAAGWVGLMIATTPGDQTPPAHMVRMLIDLSERVTDWSKSAAPARILFFAITLWAVTRRPTGWAWAWLFLAGIVAAGMLINIIKPIVGRYRPNRLFNDDIWGFSPFSIGYSVNGFPSGHSAVAGACGVLLCMLWPRLRAVWIPLAVMIAATRLSTLSHYLSDVIVGLGLGAVMGLAVYVLFRRLGLLQIDPPSLARDARAHHAS